ncbi:MAG TPA: hypothetical protein VKB69_12470 [Micromonosporaceae bacterium]|nr:hypothetical protein [Micromonosporaceae bacterium]
MRDEREHTVQHTVAAMFEAIMTRRRSYRSAIRPASGATSPSTPKVNSSVAASQ